MDEAGMAYGFGPNVSAGAVQAAVSGAAALTTVTTAAQKWASNPPESNARYFYDTETMDTDTDDELPAPTYDEPGR